ncbi:MAG TPA: hypothetical protein DEQ14_10370 [Treponema sp.]|nr:hypothetical protein [Treponema sp.]
MQNEFPGTQKPAAKDKVFAILMAAGLSKRFGGANKLLAQFKGRPLVEYTLDLVCSLGDCLDGIFFVYTDERAAVIARNAAMTRNTAVPAPPEITLIHNAAPEKGQRESVRLGVEAADAAPGDFFLFMPCDQPLLDADTVRAIIAGREKGRIVEPRHEGKPGSPCLFSGVFRDELLTLKDGEQPRVIKARHPQAVFPVTVANPLALLDIDDTETLRRLEF